MSTLLAGLVAFVSDFPTWLLVLFWISAFLVVATCLLWMGTWWRNRRDRAKPTEQQKPVQSASVPPRTVYPDIFVGESEDVEIEDSISESGDPFLEATKNKGLRVRRTQIRKPSMKYERPKTAGYKREQLPNWQAKHSAANELGLGGIWLEVFSEDGDKRQIYRCEVIRDDTTAGLWDATTKLFNAPLEEWEPVAHEKLLYPSYAFTGAPKLPLPDGDYRVEWSAVRDQLGRQIVAFDRFQLRDGELE